MATSERHRSAAQVAQRPGEEAREKAETGSGWYAWLARGGLLAKGASFALVAVLAIGVAAGVGGKTTSRQGALETLAHEGWGKVVLVLLGLGFAAYAVWRFVQAFVEREEDEDNEKGVAKKWGKRAGYVGRGIIYASLAFTTFKLFVGAGDEQSQNAKAQETTASVLDWPGGRWIVGLAGLGIIGAGLWNAYRGITKKFEDKWRRGEMSKTERKWGSRAAVAGHLARAVVFTLIGIFVVKAALEYDPQDAIGLDGALQKLADAAYGPYVLGLTAAGLLCYGLYCLVDARYRDVSTNPGSDRNRGQPSTERSVSSATS
jgi:Na+-transporting methylmalonyl-CoA/oxaloacetate decarboxylase gamma subunit